MFSVTLHQDGFTSEEAFVYTLEEASAAVTAYQRKWCMGASDMGAFHGEVRVSGRLTHTVSYNGRVWERTADGRQGPCVHDPRTVYHG